MKKDKLDVGQVVSFACPHESLKDSWDGEPVSGVGVITSVGPFIYTVNHSIVCVAEELTLVEKIPVGEVRDGKFLHYSPYSNGVYLSCTRCGAGGPFEYGVFREFHEYDCPYAGTKYAHVSVTFGYRTVQYLVDEVTGLNLSDESDVVCGFSYNELRATDLQFLSYCLINLSLKPPFRKLPASYLAK